MADVYVDVYSDEKGIQLEEGNRDRWEREVYRLVGK